MLPFTLRQLEYVVAVAEHRHFRRAAEACGVSQPALSQGVRDLESVLGTPLFERVRPRILLTPAGERFVAGALVLLDQARGLAAASAPAEGPLAGTVRLGVIPTLAPYVLPPLLQSLGDAFPEARFELTEATSEEVLHGLAQARLDTVVLATPWPLERFAWTPLFDEPFVVATRTGSALDGPGPVTPSELAGAGLLLMGEGHCLREHVQDACLLSAASQTAIRATSMTTLALMVRHGLGPTVLPILALRHEVGDADDLVLRAFASGTSGGPPPMRGVALVWRRTSPRSGGYRALADVIRARLDLLDATVPRALIRGGAPRLVRRA